MTMDRDKRGRFYYGYLKQSGDGSDRKDGAAILNSYDVHPSTDQGITT